MQIPPYLRYIAVEVSCCCNYIFTVQDYSTECYPVICQLIVMGPIVYNEKLSTTERPSKVADNSWHLFDKIPQKDLVWLGRFGCIGLSKILFIA